MFVCDWTTDRSATHYVMDQAKEWVVKHIVDFKNIILKMNSPEGTRCKSDIESIFKTGKIDNAQYERIYQCMNVEWFKKMLYGGRDVSVTVTAADMKYVFLKFPQTKNKFVPIGFIIDFFEDDYDEEKRIRELFDQYLQQQKEAICHDFEMDKSNVHELRERLIAQKEELNITAESASKCVPKLTTYIIFWALTLIISVIGLVTFFTSGRLTGLIDSLGDLPMLLRYVPNALGIVIGLIFSLTSIGRIVKEFKLIKSIKRFLEVCDKMEQNLDTIENQGDKYITGFCDNLISVFLFANRSDCTLDKNAELPASCFDYDEFEEIKEMYSVYVEELTYFMNNVAEMKRSKKGEPFGDLGEFSSAVQNFEENSISRSNKFGGKLAGKIILFIISLVTFYPIIDALIGMIIK